MMSWRTDPVRRKTYHAEYYQQNREKLKARAAEYRARKPDAVSESKRQSRLKKIDYYMSMERAKYLRKTYGITQDHFAKLHEEQAGECRICGGSFSKKTLPHVDHCHETGVIRGLLCFHCNAGLGHFQDNPDMLNRAAGYVKGEV